MNATQLVQPQRLNGTAAAGELVSINPQEAANLALLFLGRCDLKPAERDAFARVELVLQAIARGQVTLVSTSSSAAPGELEAPADPQ